MIRRGKENRPTVLSWLRNWLYRKGVESTPGEYARLFAYLAELRVSTPPLFPALAPLERLPGQLVLLAFQDPALHVYSGLEVVVFDEQRFLYYRMPGAQPNGGGRVAPGVHRVRCNSLGEPRELFMVLERLAAPAFRLVAHSLGSSPEPGDYVRLEAGELDYSWIVGELRGLIVRALAAVHDPARPEDRARLASLALRCPADDEETSRAARELATRLAAPTVDAIKPPFPAS